MKTILFVVIALLSYIDLSYSQIIQSTFSTGAENWTCEGDVSVNPTYISTNGNPGGYLSNTDSNAGDTWYWVAPLKFLGSQGSKYGKTLSYDLKQSTNDTDDANDIIIEGNGLRLLYRANYQPTTFWTTFIVSLIESSGWYIDTIGNPAPTKSQMQSVLSNITKLKIRAEYSAQKDIDGLDNVILGGARNYAGSGNACFFNGLKSYINLGNDTILKPIQQLTVQCWALFKNVSADYILVSNTSAGGYEIWYNHAENMINFYVRVNGAYKIARGKIPLANSWHHYALTYDGRFLKGYIDGILQENVDAGSNYPITYANNSTLLGAEAGTGDNPDNNYPYLNGYVDELSFWNKALIQSQIRNWMCKKITQSHSAYSNLLAYYKFDEEKSDVKLFDQKLDLTGVLSSGTSFTISGAPIGNNSANTYNGSSLKLNISDSEYIKVDKISGNPAGIHLYRVDNAPSLKKGIKGLGPNKKYFGIFPIRDSLIKYRVTYTYTGNPYVLQANEDSLKLFVRTSNSDSTWSKARATLDTLKNILIMNDDSAEEYILGSSGVPLQVPKSVSINDTIVKEGNSGTKIIKIPVRLNDTAVLISSVNYTTADSTAKAGKDYVKKSGTLNFAVGQLIDTIRINIKGDTTVEANEIFKIILSDSVNISIADTVVLVTIKNDDSAVAAIELIKRSDNTIKNKLHFGVSPNPTKSFINITSFQNITGAQIRVADMSGKTLYATKQNFVAGQQLKVSLSQFPSEVLIVTIATNNDHKQFKIIKE